MVFADAGVAFTLASLTRGTFVQLLHAAIEGANFFRARKLSASRRRPGAFVPAGKNQVGPFLILRVRYGEQLHAGIRMIAGRSARRAESGGSFLEPAQKKRARKCGIQTLRPIAAHVRDFKRLLFPAEMREGGVGLFQK